MASAYLDPEDIHHLRADPGGLVGIPSLDRVDELAKVELPLLVMYGEKDDAAQ